MLGLGNSAQTTANLLRERQCVLNLAPSSMAAAVVPGTRYVDPLRWDPLFMKFCELFGGGDNVYPSRLAAGWRMPHRLRPTLCSPEAP